MFETEGFKEQLESTVSRETARNNLDRYHTGIIDYLQGLAIRNESTLMEREARKSASARRGIPDALISANILVEEAASYAAADNRKLLTRADIEKAYQAKFCRVWPFCKE
jgi:histone H3/H4